MRIRSIRPEFWSSEDIAKHDIPTRLLFIGLWSYVDDNGVGRDVEKLINSDVFPLADDPRASLATVSRGLRSLAEGGQITRYEVEGKPYLHVTAWDVHQRVDRPGKERYPLPTREDALVREDASTVSRQSRDSLDVGEGEKGRRGEGEKAAVAADFDTWYSTYPKKVARPAALAAYTKAHKKVGAETLLTAASVMAKAYSTDKTYCPNPATWLNQERWSDEPAVADRPHLQPVPSYEPAPKREPNWENVR